MSDNTENTGVEPATKQAGDVKRTQGGHFAPGQSGNPSGKGGFGDNPENRNDGSWSKEKTQRAKLEKMFEEMTVADIMLAKTEHNVDTNLSAKIGDIAASGRLLNVFDVNDTDGKMKVNSKEYDSLMYLVYGSKSENDTTIRADEGVPIIKGFVIPTAPEDFIGDDGKQKEQQ